MFQGPDLSYYEPEADFDGGGDYIHIDEAIEKAEVADDLFTLQQILFDKNGVDVKKLINKLYSMNDSLGYLPHPAMETFVKQGDLQKLKKDLEKIQETIKEQETI